MAPGGYAGEVALQGRGSATKQISIEARLRSRVVSEGVTFLLAFGAIFLGVSGGAVLKWLAEKGTVLQGLRGQLSSVVFLAEGAHLPPQLRQELLAAEAALADFDLPQAEEAVRRIVPRIRDITSIAEFLGSLRDRVEQQRYWIDRLTPQDASQPADLAEQVDEVLAPGAPGESPPPSTTASPRRLVNGARGGALDWLSLVLWGFGAQLTGFTLTQPGGEALGSGPKLTSVP